MGSFPSGGISYALGSSILDDEDIMPQAGKKANVPMQIIQKMKLRKRSEFIALFPILGLLASWAKTKQCKNIPFLEQKVKEICRTGV